MFAPVLENIALNEPVSRPKIIRVKSQPELSENIEQIWNKHCLNKKPNLVNKNRKLRLRFEHMKPTYPESTPDLHLQRQST